MGSTNTRWILELVDRVTKPMRSIVGAGRKAEKQTSSVDRAMKRLKQNALRTFGVMAIFRGVTSIVKMGNDFEAAGIKFETLLRSKDKAVKMIADLDKFANATPFQNDALRRNAELMLNFGIAGEKVIPTIKMLSAVSGGNQDRMNSLSLAYSQVQAATRLTGQDLLQLINAGFNPLQIISKKTGKSVAFLKDEMRKGNISALAVADAFKTATSEGGRFYGMMEKLAGSGQGKISTFLGTLRLKIAKFSLKHITPIVNKVFEFGIAFINSFSKVGTALKNLAAPFKPLFSAIGSLISLIFGFGEESFKVTTIIDTLAKYLNYVAIVFDVVSNAIVIAINIITPFVPLLKGLAIVYGVMTAAQWLLNIAMTANPIGLVIVAVIGLIAIFQTAYKKLDWFRGGIDAIWVSIKGFGNAIKEFVIDRIKGMISGITGIGETLLLFFKGDWQKAWEAGKKATSDLLGIEAAKNAVNNFKQIGADAKKAYNAGVNSINNPEAKVKTKTQLGADPTNDQLALAGINTPPSGGDASGATGAVKNGITGSKGQGKIITQNLNIINHFTVDKNARASMEDLADILAGKLNDKLRDGLIALN